MLELWNFGTNNMEHEIILKYFPDLTAEQIGQFRELGRLYPDWNAKINVISRQDISNLYERHILHSLSIAKVAQFKAGTKILDAGTGGGFPGVPLAIMFPDVHFHLVDSTAKKLSVVKNITEAIGIRNLSTEHCRFEDHFVKYDFVVSRAVSSLDTMVKSLWKNIKLPGYNAIANGILYLKGGELSEELGGMEAGRQGGGGAGKKGEQLSNRTIEQLNHRPLMYSLYPLADYFKEDFFRTKMLVHLF
jgi:16S rRNA (guanine527-N7)-methyltransferase